MGISDADTAKNLRYFPFICKKTAHFGNACSLKWQGFSVAGPAKMLISQMPRFGKAISQMPLHAPEQPVLKMPHRENPKESAWFVLIGTDFI